MITNTYVTEQVARHIRQEREAAAAASRTARGARTSRTSRRQHTAPATTVGPKVPTPSSVRIPRQRRWVDAFVASVR